MKKEKNDKIDKLIDLEDNIHRQFNKIANFIHTKKIKDHGDKTIVFGTLGKNPENFFDKKGKVKKDSKYFKVTYKIDFPEKTPRGYLIKDNYISDKTITEKEFERRINKDIIE